MVWAVRKALMMVAAGLAVVLLGPASAAQRVPGWWDPDGVGAGADWHYRVPVSLASSASVNSTAKVDIDFAVLMTQLDISGTFDANSVRVVRPGGTIATTQEFSDTIYAGATDSSGNSKGEVRWIVEDGGVQTYYIYFDVTGNGSKSTNPQTAIGGNFERSSTGTARPSGWNTPTVNTNFDAQVRPAETVSVTAQPASTTDGVLTRSTNGNPNTGSFSYLMGWRSSAAALTAGSPGVSFSKTIAVPATNPGSLTFRWKPQGWGSSAFDHLRVTIVGSATTEVFGPTANNYAINPYSPNYGSQQSTPGREGYGQYNGFDCDTNGTHRLGMSVTCRSEPWFTVTQSLAGFAGQTVTLTFAATQDAVYQSWYLIDDVEWSVVAGTLGNAEGFGVAATSPGGSLAPGQTLTVSAIVDANPTAAASPLTADVINNAGTTVASAIKLYNDGTHGDGTANDANWTNNGSDSANPTYTVPLASGSSSGWKVRVYAKDASTSTLGSVNNGMVHRTGLGTTLVLANWWNIDEAAFSIDAAVIGVTKAMSIVADGVNSSNFKGIPGAQLRYCVTISNSGTAAASTVVATNSLPATLAYVPGSILSGADCASAATAEDDNASGADETDPVGASYSGTVLSVTRGTLSTASSFAVTYRVTVA